MPTVRTTMRPDQEINVGDAEYLDLQRQGLIHTDPAPAVQPATKKTPALPASGATKEG